ncbi:YajQ family cyclic di-GMP-binding protein [Anaeromyxobacter oryzisoli]|jgi:cyclic-di-GMP-binding protein|uniref:YajQ family cyclic di-GMP-binding protein n=1 Tax=Anaeromyxobacter oryzisoli TaxID=2925408 RepID=UPI001F56ED6F|nr:YajQ family cyclic di-GMP-binding protein [Anaeromyxobacter sp. SG63]
MPSFDVVSELNLMEVDNAFNQARKELAQRFDFKGTHTDLERDKDLNVVIQAGSDGRAEAALSVLMEKLAKRGVPLEGLDPQQVEPAAGGHVRQLVKLKQGLKQEDAKKIVALVKASGLKVQAAIQGAAVRISGKKKDDLQAAIQAIRGASLGVPLQFQNFRD